MNNQKQTNHGQATSKTKPIGYLLLFLVLLFPLAGCTAEMRENQKIANQLEEQIAQEFDLYRVRIISRWRSDARVENEHTLQVFFQKQFRFLESNEEEYQLVDDVALFVAQNHPDLDSVDRLKVSYVRDVNDQNQWLASRNYSPHRLLENAEKTSQ